MTPTIVAVIVWRWLLNETYGVVDDVLLRLRLVREPVVWLGVDHMMASLIAVSVWQFTPFVVVRDRKSTRLNSSHLVISYAVFCLKKKKKQYDQLLYQHDRSTA